MKKKLKPCDCKDMADGYIKMCFYDEVGWWTDMWETTLKGEVKYWQNLPEAPVE